MDLLLRNQVRLCVGGKRCFEALGIWRRPDPKETKSEREEQTSTMRQKIGGRATIRTLAEQREKRKNKKRENIKKKKARVSMVRSGCSTYDMVDDKLVSESQCTGSSVHTKV